MRGRKPIPVEQRRLEGEDVSHRPLPEPVVAGGRVHEFPGPPLDLPRDAHPFWRDTLKLLADVGILDMVDMPALVLLGTQYARAAQARRVLASEGLFASGSQGQVVAHPAVAIEQKATAMFLKLAEHYALTPIARTRLGLADLQRQSMQSELDRQLGDGSASNDGHDAEIPEADVVEVEDVGLPGV